jgi:methionyl-tRNA formyltransferase
MEKRIVFMGSPEFALPSLRALAKNWNVVGAVTQPDRAAGRGQKLKVSSVKVLAQELGLPVLQPKSLREPEAIQLIRNLSPDVIVVVAFGQILRQEVLSIPPFGCINVHASLLPRWRGAAPIQSAILHDEITGVSIMKMDQGLDTGPILRQRELLTRNDITMKDLSNQLAHLGAELLVETLPQYFSGAIEPQYQNEEEATYAPMLKKTDGELDLNKSGEYLIKQIRAFQPWPGSYGFFRDSQLKVFRAHFISQERVIPGKPYIINDQPAWGTRDGLLVLDEVQLAGKKRMSGEQFLRGAQDWPKIF